MLLQKRKLLLAQIAQHNSTLTLILSKDDFLVMSYRRRRAEPGEMTKRERQTEHEHLKHVTGRKIHYVHTSLQAFQKQL